MRFQDAVELATAEQKQSNATAVRVVRVLVVVLVSGRSINVVENRGGVIGDGGS